MKAHGPQRATVCSLVLLSFLAITPFLAAQKVVDLTWNADNGQISGYNVYRGDVTGGPYSKLNSSLDTSVTYTDSTVQASHIYYYVTTAVNSLGEESAYSNETQASVPGNGGGGNEQILFGFASSGGGPALPQAGLTFDKSGNLYGTSKIGGAYNQGSVFQLTKGSSGWGQTVIYSFTGGADGGQPTAEVSFDNAGNLYGTTSTGGSGSCTGGCGTVFELTASSSWAETVLYSFSGGSDGSQPYAGLVTDSAGNLYGTTAAGGTVGANCSSGCGVVFKLTPGSGSWSQSVLYSFGGGNDGSSPYSAVTLDPTSNLYGTTYSGGSYGKGTIFKLTSTSNGWTESVLHAFKGTDGASPVGGLVLDSAGNIYGTAYQGGSAGYGLVFALVPNPRGGWREKVLHSFGNAPSANPVATLVFDATGNLYGTTLQGGTLTSCGGGCGTLFKLTPNPTGSWTFGVRHLFGRNGDGFHPSGRLVLDPTGNFYGTTPSGWRPERRHGVRDGAMRS